MVILTDLESMWDGHVECVTVAKHHISLIGDSARMVHSVPYGAGRTARWFSATKIVRMIAEKVIKPVTIEWAATIAFNLKKDGFLYF